MRLDRKVEKAKVEGNRNRAANRWQPTKAQPTNPKGNGLAGRPKGIPNRTTAMLRHAIFLAAELEGSNQKGKDGLIGYIRALARYEKKTYVTLLAKCLPQRIQADLDPNSLMAKLLQTASATRALREQQQQGTMIDVTPKPLPKP